MNLVSNLLFRSQAILIQLLAGLFVASFASAATVEPGTGYTNDFSLQPAATDWATCSVAGSSTDTYDMDSDVNGNVTAALASTQTVADTGNPPSAAGNALWSSTGMYLQTRPTGIRYISLMGKFVNNTGTNATQIAISYLLTTTATSGSGEDAGKGTRVYYSLTGLANSWTNISDLNSLVTTETSSNVSATVSLAWPNGSSLYLLWADDNAQAVDTANQIDNFSLQVTAGAPVNLSCVLTAPANNSAVAAGSPIPFQVIVNGGIPPYGLFIWTNSGVGDQGFRIATAPMTPGAAPYNGSIAELPIGTYQIYVMAIDDEAVGSTVYSATNTFVVANPINFALTAPADNSSIDTAVNVEATTTVTGGTAPYSVQFYLDDVPNGAPVTSAPYSHSFGQIFVGDHTIRATVTDAFGWTSNSLVSTVHITGPVAALISPTNGTSISFGQPLTLSAFVAGGTAPYSVNFYTNNTLAGTVSSSPYSLSLGILEAGTYNVSARVTDSSSQQFTTAANAITITPNPIVVSLSSPTSGQTASAGVALSLSANAAVSAPLTITNVEFFLDEASAGSDSTAPYSTSVTVAAAGSHSFYAIATDMLGRQSYSATNVATFTVNPLANDNFENRIALGTPGYATGSNVGATTESGEPTQTGGFGGTTLGATMWYKWTAPASGAVTITTADSSFNTTLWVFTGSAVNALTQVTFNDNVTYQNQSSLVTFTAQQGTEYQIQVGGAQQGDRRTGYYIATGNFVVNLAMPPSVSLTSPANNSLAMLGSNIVLTATASSGAGSATQVDFYNASRTLLGSAFSAPYSIVASNLPLGTNSFYAVVTDSIGQTNTSSSINVLVMEEGVSITSPVDGAVYQNQNSITVNVSSLLRNGNITNVVVYVDGVEIGSDASAPFSVTWNNVTGGGHTISAIGTSDTGMTYTDGRVHIAVINYFMAASSIWKYLDDGSDQGTEWSSTNFDDSSWAAGPAPLGWGYSSYGWNNYRYPATTNSSGYITTYYRQTVVIDDPAKYTSFTLGIQRDDGVVIYLNGSEVVRQNISSGITVDYLTTATSAYDNGSTTYTGTLSPALFVPGTNYFAVELHQDSATSSDAWFQMELSGMPRVIHNEAPIVTLDSPANNSTHLAAGMIMLSATATDPDGTVTNVAFFEGETKLGQVSSPPYTLSVLAEEPGVYNLAVAATDDQGSTAMSLPVKITVYPSSSRWVAYNDHYAGPGTHPNVTAWNAFGTLGGAPGQGGSLRNIQTGAQLSSYLAITNFGASGITQCGAPVSGTPAYNLFNGYVDFGSDTVNNGILVTPTGYVVYRFTGLNPSRQYNFRATVVGGLTGTSNRWTLLTISNATSFVAAHTTNVLTSAQQSALAADEAALNTGDNSTGDVIRWDHIVPGEGGSFVVVATQYLGPAPGNEVPGAAAYAPVAIRLEELGANPLVTVTKPLAGEVITGPTNLITAAEPISILPITNMVFLGNGTYIGQTNQAPYTVSWSDPPFGTLDFQAVAIDAEGYCTTSAPVTMTLITPPTNTIPPMIYKQSPLAESILTNYFTNVQVIFSQPVVNVDARDLLINDVPALNVVNTGGTNFLFSFAQPAYGSVRVRFASDHGITDLSWPNHLAFYENDIGASWNYTLVDRVAPVLLSKTPAHNAFVTNASQITVVFSKPVTGVDAGDLKVNGIPCYGMSGSGATYTFYFSQPRSGAVSVGWLSTHGITDLATPPNAFSGASGWIFTLDARTILIQTNSTFALLKGNAEASNPTNAWTAPGFDESGWTIANAPFFYGDTGYTNQSASGTQLEDMSGNYSSIYLRKTFVVKNAAAVTNLQLLAQMDDGFVAWINGYEVKRYNVGNSGDIPFNGVALASVLETTNNAAGWSNFALPNPKLYLIDGTNDLAIHAFNYSLTDDDFGFNAQLFTYLPNTELEAPRVASKSPPAGFVYSLTNITVAFTERVTNVEASHLLINGVPANNVSVSNNIAFTFTLSQPAYGPVTISWAANHGIVDLDATPKPFDSSIASANWQYTLLNPSSPHLDSVTPTQGRTITGLTQISMTFNEPVVGLDASDLLINGVPATGLTGDGVNFTFTFPQPPYGTVSITWAANHGITDLESPANSFDVVWPNHVFNYTLEDRTPPSVASQDPPAGSSVSSLTQLTVAFTEPVAGVDAFDLLVNGHAATGVSGSSATYTFTFPAQNASQLLITWSATHGIHDLSAYSNVFNGTATGNTWSYQAMDITAPSVASVYPPASAAAKSLTNVEVTFDEPVNGVTAESLLMNNIAALEVTGTGAGPYAFIFSEPATGLVQVAWAPGQQIYDFASTPNHFAGGSWSYVYNPNLNLSFAVSHVVHISLDGLGAFYLQNYLNNISLPTYEKLRLQGAYTLNARCDYSISVTLPNHACMFTGRPAQQPSGWDNTTYHGLTIDSDNGTTIHSAGNPNVPYKSSLFDVAHDNGLSTAFLYSKQSLTFFARSWNGTYGAADTTGVDNGSNKIDFVFNSTPNGSSYGPTADVVDEFVAHVETNGLWGYTFLHFDDGDATGHASDWGSDAYEQAVLNTDTQIGRVLDAIQSNASYSNTTILIVTADHGGGAPTNSHTTATSYLNYTVPIFVVGPGIPAGTNLYDIMANRADPGSNRYAYSDTSVIQPLHNGDTGNLGLSLLGLPSIPGSSLIPVIGSKSVSLTLSQSGDTVSVSWPSYATGQLKVSNTLGASANWQTITDGITTVGNLKVYSFTPAPGAPVQFFSLQK